MRTAPVILAPSGIFIMNDRIWVIQIQKDTLFDVFDLHDCSYLYSTGTKGAGPDEFIFPMAQTIQVDRDEFTIFDNIMLKTIEASPNGHIHVKKREKIFSTFPVNGFMKINDSLFCAFADCATGMTGDFEFEFKLKNIRSGEETKFGKYPDLTTRKYQGDQKCQIYYKHSISNSSQGKFATFYSFFKFFRIYSINGESEKEIHVNIEPYGADNLDDWEKRNIYYERPVATSRYIYAKCDTNEIQVWDWDGNPIIQYFLEHEFHSFAVSEKTGKLYAIAYSIEEENIDKIYVYDVVH
jgi:hypothetical protein